ncbi:MAG TPA: MFS transporter [Thermomicrobiaceae bacterium]|nr:MFS transporter [Thermomicrobiaceae bacterium]
MASEAKPIVVPDRRKWLVLIAVSIGTFMATLDSSIVNIALPQIQSAFGVQLPTVEWVVVTYLLIRGALLLPFGRLGEVVGYKRVYVTGFVIFSIASGLCGISSGIWMLVGFRALQAFGGAMLSSMGPAIVTGTFGSGERGKALGLNSVSVSIGLSVGPTLGGILTQYGSWHWIFFVNVPIGVVAIFWAMRVLTNEAGGRRQSFDLLGAFLSFCALLALLLALVQGEAWGWLSVPIVALIVLFAVLGTGFVMAELRLKVPMLDLEMFKNRVFSAGNAALLISFAGSFMPHFSSPSFWSRGRASRHCGPVSC